MSPETYGLTKLVPKGELKSSPGPENDYANTKIAPEQALLPAILSLSLTVNTLGDAADANIGDGHCDTDGNLVNGDQCTLRAAIQEANAVSGDKTIALALGTGVATIELNTSLPDIQGNLIINGPGAKLLTVRRSLAGGTPAFRVFTISPGANVTISGLTISNGSATGSFPANAGGGILNNEATLVINDSVITGNTANSGGAISNLGTLTINNSSLTNNSGTDTGGAIANSTGGTQSAVLNIRNSTIANNSTPNSGGGIFNIGQASLTNSTVSGNSASSGGGINNANPMSLINVTVTNNSATAQGGGITNPGIGVLNFSNTIIAGNSSPSGADCSGANFSSQDYNLIGSTAGFQVNGPTTHNITNVDARLGLLGNNGGATPTHDLLDGSPAIDKGHSMLTTDQRGQPRPVDNQNIPNAEDGNASDIGAYETPTFQVNSTADTNDGSCTLPGTGNGCTLREAIIDANTTAGAQVITFAPALTTDGPATITFFTEPPSLSSEMTISGPGANLLTIQRSTAEGTPNFRIININQPGPMTISGVTITNGHTENGVPANEGASGGGILNNGSLTLINLVISANTTGNGGDAQLAGRGGDGGGIANFGDLIIVGSTIANNSTGSAGTGTLCCSNGGRGAGIANFGILILTNCTISNNNTGNGSNNGGAAGSGGGIFNQGALTVINNTVINNKTGFTGTGSGGGNGGGIFRNAGTINLQHTIVANNSVGSGALGPDLSGEFNSQDYNLIENISGATFTGETTHNIIGLDPLLGPLANNGGSTVTHALLAGSPALDAGNPAFIGPPFTDQRGAGFNRIVDGPDADATATVDIGACESQVTLDNLADATTNEDTQLIVPFEIEDRASITSITAISNNPTLVPNDPSHLLVTDAGATEVLTVNPAADLFGTADITVTVNRTSSSTSRTFTVTVNSANDAPSFLKGSNQTIDEDAGAQIVSNWATNISAGPPDESDETLSFQIINNTNASLFSSGPTISSTGRLTYTPAANANGSATITVVLKDNGGTTNGGVDTSAAQKFTIEVNPVNDAPSFTTGPNQNVNEDAGLRTVQNWATNILAGPNESGQTLTFEVTNNTNPGLFSSGPAISSAGTLTYTPAENANGSSTIFIVLKDNGGVANGGQDTSVGQSFTISVNPVNDAPSFTKGPDQTVNNNAGSQTFNNWATGLSAGPANESSQTATFLTTVNSNPGLFSAPPAISSTGTLTYTPATNAGGTATITVVLKDNGGTANGGQDTSPAQTFNISINPVGGFLRFESSSFTTTESSGSTTITVERTGDTSLAVAVDFATSGENGTPCSTTIGVASSKCDFSLALGTLNFASGEDTKTFIVLITQDSYIEGPENVTLSLTNPAGFASFDAPSAATLRIDDDDSDPATNPNDDPQNFVRQHYHDFLNREPDADGLAFWTNEITSCGADPQCIEIKRINVSAAFFLSIEFQETGYLVYRMYKAAYGDTSSPNVAIPVPIIRLNEFVPDSQGISQGVQVGIGDWQAQLEANKIASAREFVVRQRFLTAYPVTMTTEDFVGKLNLNAGDVLSQTERAELIEELNAAGDVTQGRASVLRKVAEDADLSQRETNRAFVLMQYYGYLRRNPDDPQDIDFRGWEFWLNKLNQFNGNFIQAEMTKAFITSTEYRQRFGP